MYWHSVVAICSPWDDRSLIRPSKLQRHNYVDSTSKCCLFLKINGGNKYSFKSHSRSSLLSERTVTDQTSVDSLRTRAFKSSTDDSSNRFETTTKTSSNSSRHVVITSERKYGSFSRRIFAYSFVEPLFDIRNLEYFLTCNSVRNDVSS